MSQRAKLPRQWLEKISCTANEGSVCIDIINTCSSKCSLTNHWPPAISDFSPSPSAEKRFAQLFRCCQKDHSSTVRSFAFCMLTSLQKKLLRKIKKGKLEFSRAWLWVSGRRHIVPHEHCESQAHSKSPSAGMRKEATVEWCSCLLWTAAHNL